MSNTKELEEIFSFDDKDIARHLFYDQKIKRKFIRAFNYICSKLPVQKVPKDLNDLTWDEGKNYHWAVVQEGDLTMIIRQYRSHFTFFFRNREKLKGEDAELPDAFTDEYYSKWGCFTFSTERELLSDEDSDARVDDNFLDINKYLPPIIQHVKKGKVWLLWNSAAIPRDKWIEIKNVWDGGEDITSVDLFLFALEELFGKYLELYAQNDMLEHLKVLKPGDKIGHYTIKSVNTKVKGDYYHNAGISFKEKGESFADVYSLSRYYLEDVLVTVEEKKEAAHE